MALNGQPGDVNSPYSSQLRVSLICVDAYAEGLLQGRLLNPFLPGEYRFDNLMQLILGIEQALKRMRFPQPYAAGRSFWSDTPITAELPAVTPTAIADLSGKIATFRVHIMFRQNASWQGSILWCEANKEENFRSLLELVLLMHNALSRLEQV